MPRKIKDEWEEIFDNITDMITIHDKDFNIIHANKAALEKIIGSSVLKHPKAKCFKYYHRTESPPAGCANCKCLETGEPAIFETYEPHLNMFLEIRAMPRFNASNEIIGSIHIVRDITEKKKAEELQKKHQEELKRLVEERTAELQKANEQLKKEILERCSAQEEAMRAAHLASLGELAAGVAHEINNPINGIINYAQILLNRSPKESKEGKIAERIIREGHRISKIVKNLLSFAKQQIEERQFCCLSDLIDNVLTLTEAQLKKDGIRLAVEVPDDLPDVLIQPQQIEQVLLNLISNARYALNQKHKKAGSDKFIKISVQKLVKESDEFLQISVRDNGTGIPSKIIDKVMHPFFSTKPHSEGAGLGLSISHGIISAHAGRLKIQSVEGEYTEVIIELPLCLSNRTTEKKTVKC